MIIVVEVLIGSSRGCAGGRRILGLFLIDTFIWRRVAMIARARTCGNSAGIAGFYFW